MIGAASARTRALLDDTIAHARSAPHYAKAWRGKRVFASLPLLDKATAAEQQEALRIGGEGSPALLAGVVSSATTRSGRPLRVPFDDDDAAGSMRKRPKQLTLVIYSPRHGVRHAGADDEVLLPATLHANTIDVAWDLLRNDRRFDALVCPLSTLKWLTVGLLERGHDLGKLRLDVVGATGYPVTSFSRAWLEGAWGCRLVDNYSLSELPGFAYPSRVTGFQHWVNGDVFFELVDPLTARTVPGKTGALGELVATSLLPAAKRMPLVRYRTGDIVEVGPVEKSGDFKGRRGIRFRGRTSQSILGPGQARYRALGRDLLELGEALPDVAMEPHPAEVLRLVPPCDVGVPKILVENGRRPRVRVELRFDPARYPGRALDVAAAFRDVVHESVPIDLVRPGTLDVHALVRKL
jgi:hypothetical protein